MKTYGDPFDLQRFIAAQEPVFETVLEELETGRKRSHWMWFIFPQLRGLGRSSMAEFYGISSLDEAKAYLNHPVLGLRLRQTSRIVLQHNDRSLRAIFGSPDDMKFRTSMTLFAQATEAEDDPFREALDRLCSGELDPTTLSLLQARAGW